MLAKVLAGAMFGVAGPLVEVELAIAHGRLPSVLIVVPPDAAVQEARERARAAG